jgi:hypothetical protein
VRDLEYFLLSGNGTSLYADLDLMVDARPAIGTCAGTVLPQQLDNIDLECHEREEPGNKA